MKKIYSQEFKEQIVQEHFAGNTITKLAKETHFFIFIRISL